MWPADFSGTPGGTARAGISLGSAEVQASAFNMLCLPDPSVG
jgi:hypothetical protein